MLKMKMQPMLKYSISCLLLLVSFSILGQENGVENDSITYQEKYGLRLGGDMSKVVRTLIDDDYTGFEINGDYRLTKNLYVAGEIGTEEKTTTNDFLDVTTSGSYLKGGVDYNMYQNWFGMENMIFAGFRVGAGTFKQIINSYTIYNTNQTFPQLSVNESREINGLTGIWGEIIIGLKAETLNNLYIGMNVQFKGLVSETQPDNFENIYIPGFNRTYDSGRFGVGFGYNISYLIPLYKKDK